MSFHLCAEHPSCGGFWGPIYAVPAPDAKAGCGGSAPRCRFVARRRWCALTLAGLSAIVLALGSGCRDETETETEAAVEPVEPVVVGFLPWRDADGRTREGDVFAARMAFSELNARGGVEVDGRVRNVKLVVTPTPENPEEALENATRLVNQDRVVAIVGPYTSDSARAVAGYTETVSVPMVTPSATAPEVTAGRRFAFRATFVDEVQGRAMAMFLRTDLNVERAALMYDLTRDYSVGIAESFRAAFVELGGRLVYDEALTRDAPNIDELVLALGRSNPSVVFLPNTPDLSLTIVRKVRDAGIGATLAGGDTWFILPTLAPEAAGLLEGSYYVSLWHPETPGEMSQRFVRAYREQTGEVPTVTQALTYDAFRLLFAAMNRAEDASPLAIRNALASMRDYEAVTGTISYRGSGDPDKAVVILKREADGSHFVQSIHVPVVTEPPPP